MTDVVQTTIDAMSDAIRNQETAITSDAGPLHAIVIALEIANDGAVIDSRCTVERRGVHRMKRKEPAV